MCAKLCLLIILGIIVPTFSFPDGSPVDACVNKKANKPNHGQFVSQNLNSLPFDVVAETDVYEPGQLVKVSIKGSDVFRGFFIQARDANNDEWIGTWRESPNTRAIPECAAITHHDNKDKVGATLIWEAPKEKSGRVYFTGSVVKDYATFWTDIIAKIPVSAQQQLQYQRQNN